MTGHHTWTVELKITSHLLDITELDWFDKKSHGMRFRVGANHPDQGSDAPLFQRGYGEALYAELGIHY